MSRHQRPDDLQTTMMREVARAWHTYNLVYFHGVLRPPVFALIDNAARLGEWRPRERTLALSRQLVLDQPWSVVVEVLKHEVAHQYVSEVLKPVSETAHGAAFRYTCQRMDIDPGASGLPRPEPEPQAQPAEAPRDPARTRALGKVRRLLALAESDNAHEAEAAMARAHALMRKYNIAWVAQDVDETYVSRKLGEPRLRVPGHESVLSGILAGHFFVEVVWLSELDLEIFKRRRVMEISGTPENVELAEYAYGFVLRTAQRLWAAERAAGAPGGGRQRFLTGVIMGFGEKLDDQARVCEQEQGLVWTGDPRLQDYVSSRYPYLRAGRRSSVTPDQSWERGRQAGRGIVLHKAVSGSAGARGNLLKGGS